MATQEYWDDPMDTAPGLRLKPEPKTLRCPKGHETPDSGNGDHSTFDITVALISGPTIHTGQRCMACLAEWVIEHIPSMEPIA
jgi:hypothetical protein